MPDRPTTFEATLNNKGKLSATKKSPLQHRCNKQYFRLFLDDNATVKVLEGAPSKSLLPQDKIDGKMNVLILKDYSIIITLKGMSEQSTRNYFFSYGGNKRTSLKRN